MLEIKENELPFWRQMTEMAEQVKQYVKNKNDNFKSRCPACGQLENIVWVHGHGQCAYCKMNVMPCCDGETCE